MLNFKGKDVMVRPATAGDVERMANRLRASDVAELWAANHDKPKKALMDGLACSEPCMAVIYRGAPVAMFGVAPHESGRDFGCIWLLATPELEKIKTTFLKVSRKFIDEMLKVYPVLFNMVDDRNKTSIEWLKWCGADMAPATAYGPDDKAFRYFEFRRISCAE